MSIINEFTEFTNNQWVRMVLNVIDILLVWLVIYKILNIDSRNKGSSALKGIFVIIIIRIITVYFGLTTLGWMTKQVIKFGFLAIIIIFQPELRRALEQLGRGKLFARGNLQEEEEQARLISAMSKSVSYMAKRRIGALISIERETGLNDYIETGIPMYSEISSELIINIFIPNTPLHDGAVIVQKNKIAAAACYLPLSESPFISKELGTRHRAAIGIGEVTDAVTIVVSEETGAISLTINGDLHRDLSIEEFESRLKRAWFGEPTMSIGASKWNWRGDKNDG